jgi:transposase-like protein
MLYRKGLDSFSTFVAFYGILPNAFDVRFRPNFIASGASCCHERITETKLIGHGVMARRRCKRCHRNISNANDYAISYFRPINENWLGDFMPTAQSGRYHWAPAARCSIRYDCAAILQWSKHWLFWIEHAVGEAINHNAAPCA